MIKTKKQRQIERETLEELTDEQLREEALGRGLVLPKDRKATIDAIMEHTDRVEVLPEQESVAGESTSAELQAPSNIMQQMLATMNNQPMRYQQEAQKQ